MDKKREELGRIEEKISVLIGEEKISPATQLLIAECLHHAMLTLEISDETEKEVNSLKKTKKNLEDDVLKLEETVYSKNKIIKDFKVELELMLKEKEESDKIARKCRESLQSYEELVQEVAEMGMEAVKRSEENERILANFAIELKKKEKEIEEKKKSIKKLEEELDQERLNNERLLNLKNIVSKEKKEDRKKIERLEQELGKSFKKMSALEEEKKKLVHQFNNINKEKMQISEKERKSRERLEKERCAEKKDVQEKKDFLKMMNEIKTRNKKLERVRNEWRSFAVKTMIEYFAPNFSEIHTNGERAKDDELHHALGEGILGYRKIIEKLKKAKKVYEDRVTLLQERIKLEKKQKKEGKKNEQNKVDKRREFGTQTEGNNMESKSRETIVFVESVIKNFEESSKTNFHGSKKFESSNKGYNQGKKEPNFYNCTALTLSFSMAVNILLLIKITLLKSKKRA